MLDKYRERAGLNKSTAAHLIGISDCYYSRLEMGAMKDLSIENLEKIKDIYILSYEEY